MQAWVTETPGGGDEQSKSLYNETGARRRRAHPKSRNGCQHCKQRRVKCDEVRPSCGQCIERKWKCEYPPPERRSRLSPPPRNDSSESLAIPKTEPETPPTSISDSGSPAAESRNAIHVGVIAYLERTSVPRRKLEPDGPQARLAVELVDHFLDTTELWVGSSVSQTIIQRHAFPMAFNASYLLHAVLGCAASHLSFLHPEEERYRSAALLHYTRSLQAYSSQLVHDIEHGDGQAMMAASGLLAKLTFINTVAMNANEPLSSRTSPVCWIRSMQGVKVILSTPNLKTQLQSGFLLPILQRYKTPPPMDINIKVDSQDPDSPTSMLARLRDFCAISSLGTADPYTPVITRLAPYILAVPDHDSVDEMMAIVAGVETSFIELLEQCDTRALLILCYWCARLPFIQQWWTGPSARIECRRMCAYLCRSEDPRVHALLRYPARCCGFDERYQ